MVSNVVFSVIRLEEPPVSACPSETEEAVSDKGEENEADDHDNGSCDCPNYISNLLPPNSSKASSQEVVDRWTCAAVPSTSELELDSTTSATTTATTTTSNTTTESNSSEDSSSQNNSDSPEINIDQIVIDHDNFGTDENEDSMDSEMLEAERYDRLLHEERINANENSTQNCSMDSTTSNPYHDAYGNSVPSKRKASNSLDDEAAFCDDSGCSSGKKQCVLTPDQTLEISSSKFDAASPSVILHEDEPKPGPSDESINRFLPEEEEVEFTQQVGPSSNETAPAQDIMDWLGTFGRWSHSDKLTAINHLINQCQPSQVRHMMAVIEPQFQRDFISLLPKEVSIFMHLNWSTRPTHNPGR